MEKVLANYVRISSNTHKKKRGEPYAVKVARTVRREAIRCQFMENMDHGRVIDPTIYYHILLRFLIFNPTKSEFYTPGFVWEVEKIPSEY